MMILTIKQCMSVSGGMLDPFGIPDPVVPNMNPPIPDKPDPQPEPYWNWFLNLGWGVPTPEPAKPKVGFP